jgi:formamidopyrimidine-DNA glycosylase
MPELPEVRTVVEYLKNHLKGKTILEFKLFYNPLFVNLKTSSNIIEEIAF